MIQFSEELNRVVIVSKEEARRLGTQIVGPEHILLALVDCKDCQAHKALAGNRKRTLAKYREILEAEVERHYGPFGTAGDMEVSVEVSNLIKDSLRIASARNSSEIDSLDLLRAMIRNKGFLGELLVSGGVTEETLDLLQEIAPQDDQVSEEAQTGTELYADEEDLAENPEGEEGEEEETGFRVVRLSAEKPAPVVPKNSNKSVHKETPFLDKFSSDITQAASQQLLDPVVGREKEIERLAQILSRRKKNNPILIGEPGVGKSAIVEGLAMRILEGTVPHTLLNKRVVRLDMASIVAGTKFRGQFEERMQKLIHELKDNQEVILFLDEIHTIIGAGASSGTMDAANLLKPALARGEMQCIGATTLDEYRNSIEKDGALERRFQKIIVEPSTPEETLQILENIKDRYEAHHHVKYTDEALQQAVRLAERYLTDRNFPDKAIDVMDEAGSRAHIQERTIPEELVDLNKKRALMIEKKNAAITAGNYQLATSFRAKEVALDGQIAQVQEDFLQESEKNATVIGTDLIAQVVSQISGVPVTKMAQAEGNQLRGMKEVLTREVVDQDEAVETLVRAIQRSRIGLKDPNRPIGTFMFLGPTGVGKTLLAKELAKFMFGSADALIRIDMSEYMEKFTVSRLVGAPPGYVGYEEGGQLTEQVRRRPYSIVLLDEIEKAHPDVFNLLLQVMDEGRLTDSNGRTVDFRNAVIIMTSNVGSRQLKEFGQGIGFTRESGLNGTQQDAIVRKALQKQFAPEFLNRLDEIISFHALTQESMLNILDIELGKLETRVSALGYTLQVPLEARKFLAGKGFDPQYGARPLRRSIQTYLEDALSTLLINESPATGSTLTARVEDDKLALEVTKCPLAIPIVEKSLNNNNYAER